MARNNEHRAPDYILKVRGEKKKWNRVGVLWVNPSGCLSIKLDPFVVISGATTKLISGFSKDYQEKKKK